jgi:hypothetical protein
MTDRAQHGVIELLGRFDIVGADHYVREHGLLCSCQNAMGFRLDLGRAPRSSTVLSFTSIRQRGGELETASQPRRKCTARSERGFLAAIAHSCSPLRDADRNPRIYGRLWSNPGIRRQPTAACQRRP